jgi:hypothetical protein
MKRRIGGWLLVIAVAAAGCSLTRENSGAGGVEDIQAAESEACAGVCFAQFEACAGDDARTGAQCAAESRRCAQSCASAYHRRVYAFYCQAEAYTRRGLVLSDGSCVGATGHTLDGQRSSCELEFEPPSEAFAYTVNCNPILAWVGAGGGIAEVLRSPAAGSVP